jgi:hypothetical protein
MALNTRVGATSRNAALDAQTAQLNSGFLDIYDGTQPTDPDTALGSQVLLAHLTLSATASAAASSGTATFNAIGSDASADATGTATWYTLKTSGSARRIDGSVGTSGCNLNLNTVSIVAGATVAVSSLTLSLPMQGA